MQIPDLTINPDAAIELHPIDADNQCVVVDDFLLHPETVIELAEQHADLFSVPRHAYPGLVADININLTGDLRRYIQSKMARQFGFLRGGLDLTTVLSMATLKPEELSNLQRLCHSDPRTTAGRLNYAAVLYLFKDEALGGTGFYRWKDRPTMEKATELEMQDPEGALAFLKESFASFSEPASYMTESNDVAELLTMIPARFNRWLFYPGSVPHSAFISAPEKLTSDFRSGRLTLNCFASVVPK